MTGKPGNQVCNSRAIKVKPPASSENQELLRTIKERKPASLKELEIVTGRKRSNLPIFATPIKVGIDFKWEIMILNSEGKRLRDGSWNC